ncbi:MAG: metal-dependent hydrolase [Alphaproteobacteria bacterium]|nr:metal-dependent hydrolase [Alphaproteobacteria bacterium]
MDSVTHLLFGAVIGQAGFRAKLGRKALIAGAVINFLPDLDVIAGWTDGHFAEWEHHRGLTHSLFFGPLAGPLIGWALWRHDRWSRRRQGGATESADDTLGSWIRLAILALMAHPLIDLFTSYGTQLLWPLSATRFAIDSMPIIEPVYSLALLIAVIVGSRAAVRPRLAQDVAVAALLFVGIYVGAGWAINEHIAQVARADLDRPAEVSAYPLLFQPYYRRVVAFTPESAYVGYYSVLDPRPIDWLGLPIEATPAVAAVRGTREGALFDWFAMGKVLWRSAPDGSGGTTVEATDLRYGMEGPTNLGNWGLRTRVDSAHKPTGPIQAFTVPREVTGDAIRRYWAAIIGGDRKQLRTVRN